MKIAAVHALAELAKEPVPDVVMKAYGKTDMSFGREYVVPTPLDPRLIEYVAPAVAKAAIESGVATKEITDWDAYRAELRERMGIDHSIMRSAYAKAKSSPKRVVFTDASDVKVLQAAIQVKNDGIAFPILVGSEKLIRENAEEYSLDITGIEIVNFASSAMQSTREKYAKLLCKKRNRKGMAYAQALSKMFDENYFAVTMVENGDADAMIAGINTKYNSAIRPALQLIGKRDDINKIAGMYIMNTNKGPYFFADTTITAEPTAQELVDITLLTANEVRSFGIDPNIALITYSNFGSAQGPSASKMSNAVSILHKEHPHIMVDGEMQANFALNKELRIERYPFSKLGNRSVNTLIFPNLSSGNIAYKMLQEIGHAEAIGPIVMGLKKPVHVLQLSSSVREIVDMTAIAVVDAINGQQKLD